MTFLTLSDIAAVSAEHAGKAQVFSDLHKDALGFRPRGSACEFTSVEDFDATWDYLIVAMRESMEAERQSEIRRLQIFNERITDIQKLVVNATVQDAIRYIAEADDLLDDLEAKDYDYLDYDWGLKYGTVRGLMG